MKDRAVSALLEKLDGVMLIPERGLKDVANGVFVKARMIDIAIFAADDIDPSKMPPPEKRVMLKSFLASFCVPEVAQKNMRGIWEDNLGLLMETEDIDKVKAECELLNDAKYLEGMAAMKKKTVNEIRKEILSDIERHIATESDPRLWVSEQKRKLHVNTSLLMAQNHPSVSLATTSLDFPAFEGSNECKTLHIVTDKNGAAMMVGETISAQLRKSLAEAGITYVGRDDVDAYKKTSAALNRIVEGKDGYPRDRLREAFMYRNMIDEDDEDNASAGQSTDYPKTLAAGLLSSEYVMLYSKFICKV